jgi:predicted PurR-regulated permease PerM
MSVLVLFCLSFHVFIGVVLSITPMKTLTDRQININKTITNEQTNTNADINRQTKQHQYKHQNIEKKHQ